LLGVLSIVALLVMLPAGRSCFKSDQRSWSNQVRKVNAQKMDVKKAVEQLDFRRSNLPKTKHTVAYMRTSSVNRRVCVDEVPRFNCQCAWPVRK
jgi:hypothetical protein